MYLKKMKLLGQTGKALENETFNFFFLFSSFFFEVISLLTTIVQVLTYIAYSRKATFVASRQDHHRGS